jgi:hypothetical protein
MQREEWITPGLSIPPLPISLILTALSRYCLNSFPDSPTFFDILRRTIDRASQDLTCALPYQTQEIPEKWVQQLSSRQISWACVNCLLICRLCSAWPCDIGGDNLGKSDGSQSDEFEDFWATEIRPVNAPRPEHWGKKASTSSRTLDTNGTRLGDTMFC